MSSSTLISLIALEQEREKKKGGEGGGFLYTDLAAREGGERISLFTHLFVPRGGKKKEKKKNIKGNATQKDAFKPQSISSLCARAKGPPGGEESLLTYSSLPLEKKR